MNHRRYLLVLERVRSRALSVVLILSAGFTAKADASWGFSLTNLDTTCKPCRGFLHDLRWAVG